MRLGLHGLVLAGLLCLAPYASAATAPPGSAGLLDQVLLASTGYPATDELRERALHELERAAEEFPGRRAGYRRARRLHRWLHSRYLTAYDAEADGLEQIFEDGRFNCLSATLFEGLVYRRLGYEVRVVEHPQHVRLQLVLPGRDVEIETTALTGFDVPALEAAGPLQLDGAAEIRVPWLRAASGHVTTVSLDEAVGLLWLNTGYRRLERGETRAAAIAVAEATRHLPRLPEVIEGVRPMLARAFRLDYEAGRFDDAYDIASIEMELFDASVSSRDRLLAAAVKLVERLCGEDEARAAREIVDDAGLRFGDPVDLARLERRAAPWIARAAIRTGELDLARDAAARYRNAEPDPVEGHRLQRWVEERAGSGETPALPLTDRLSLED